MLKSKLATLPMEPGCYLMKNKYGEVIYVGKAKKLKNRVNQYFVGSHDNKTTKMVSEVVDFEYIVAPSEKEALILEYYLIKQYNPKYNIVFMVDASYPYIRLTLEDYPTLKVVRDSKHLKNAKYFGPYPNASYAHELVDLLQQLYPLRKCKKLPNKVCLYYHLGQCLGPCEYDIDKEIYKDLVEKITKFINGDTAEIKEKLINDRNNYSENLQFEQAQKCQEMLEAIDHVTSKASVQSNNPKQNEDVFAYYVDKGFISIVGLLYRDGKLLHRHLILKPIYEDPDEAFISYLIQYYQHNPTPKLLLLPKQIDIEGLSEAIECKIHQPIKGQKKKLIDLAVENAQINLNQKFAIASKELNDVQQTMEQLQKLTGSSTHRIELYDNSHISGEYAVAGMVVYIDGVASKKDYRLYRVHNRNNDYANMQEVLYRRFFRAIKEDTSLPDMVIVDGGAPQIKAACQIIDSLNLNVNIYGLVKNDKHQTASLMDRDLKVIEIDRESPLFFQLTRMQDEVHRFAISYHKKVRSKEMTHSQLDDIPGIGPKRKKLLLKHFGTLKKIEESSEEELASVVGKGQAKIIKEYFKEISNENDL